MNIKEQMFEEVHLKYMDAQDRVKLFIDIGDLFDGWHPGEQATLNRMLVNIIEDLTQRIEQLENK